jgi:hypothetical protein
MDGPRVAISVRDPQGPCDEVLYWNVLRAPLQRISAPEGPTCVPGRPTGISTVAIGGFRTEWLAQSGSRAALVVGSPLCQEWVVRRLVAGAGGERVVAMAADGRTLAFAVTDHQRELRGLSSVDVVSGVYSPRTIITGRAEPVALAVSGTTVATLLADGTADLRTARGRLVARLAVGAAKAIALDDGRLVALRPGRLDVYDVSTGSRVRSIGIPAGTSRALDVQFGIAVVGTGAAPLAGIAIERPGVVFASTVAGHGAASFVPLSRVEALLGRSS